MSPDTASTSSGPPLAGKTVLITGAARRIGATIARTLHEAGANIVLHYRSSADEANELAASLDKARRGSVVTAQCDLLATAKLPALIRAATQAFGQLDMLINNASTFYPTAVGEITEQAWDDLMGSNLKAPLFLTQAAAPALRLAHGQVLNIVDIHGMRPLRRYPVYSAAKAGLIMLTKALAKELAPLIRVNAVAPGPVMWPSDVDNELKHNIINKTLLKRPGSPEDVARAVLFFATQAPYVTGQILAIDGGRSVDY
jgi:pteridine reductase